MVQNFQSGKYRKKPVNLSPDSVFHGISVDNQKLMPFNSLLVDPIHRLRICRSKSQ